MLSAKSMSFSGWRSLSRVAPSRGFSMTRSSARALQTFDTVASATRPPRRVSSSRASFFLSRKTVSFSEENSGEGEPISVVRRPRSPAASPR